MTTKATPQKPKFDPTPFSEFNKDGIRKVAYGHQVTEQQLVGFCSNVKIEDGCWIWTGKRTTDGLPFFRDCPDGPARLKTAAPMAHRTSYAWFRGRVLRYPYCKLVQTCGKKGCVNPVHLVQRRVRDKEPVALSAENLDTICSRIEVQGDGCWRWTAETNNGGYAVIHYNGQLRSVDAITLEWFVGLPPGHSLDTDQIYHRCGHKACVNPLHYELVPSGTRKALLLNSAAPPEDDDDLED